MVKKIPPYSSFCYKRFVFEKREIGQNRWKLWHIGDIISIIISRPPIKRRLVTVDSFAVSQLNSLLSTLILTLDPPIHRRVETNSGFGSRRAQPHNHFPQRFQALNSLRALHQQSNAKSIGGTILKLGTPGPRKGTWGTLSHLFLIDRDAYNPATDWGIHAEDESRKESSWLRNCHVIHHNKSCPYRRCC